MSIYDDTDEFLNYLSGANRGAYNLKDLGELGINTDLFNFNLDLPELNLGNMIGQLDDLINFDPELLSGFAKLFPEDYKVLQDILSSNTGNLEQDYVVTDKGTVVDTKGEPLSKITNTGNLEQDYVVTDKGTVVDTKGEPLSKITNTGTGAEGAGFLGENVKSGVKEWDDAAEKAGVKLTDSTKTGASILKQLADATGLSEDTLKNLLLGGAGLLGAKASYDDAKAAREAAKGTPFKSSSGYKTVTGPGGVTGFKKAAQGGVMSLDMAQGRYLGGITDGMADKVPASIDNRR
ncbi:hypothetical protein EB118_24310, partial [bacterium]|nr:hypothetical protein [bacterium]